MSTTTDTTKLRLRGIRHSFLTNGAPTPVLDGIDLHVSEGELVSVIGPSGCGKSTLLNVITGLQDPDPGAVFVDGVPADSRLGIAGYMHQEDLLMPWRTVLDNTILGLEVQGVPRKEARAKALVHFDAFGLSGYEKQWPHSLSGGMRQRAALLRTVLMERDIILLDEPFGALDALTRSQMQQWLMELWDSLNKTILLVTHDIEEALLLSDRIYVLSSRPAQVKTVVDVDLPRPRRYDMIADERFMALRQSIIADLHQENEATAPSPGDAAWR